MSYPYIIDIIDHRNEYNTQRMLVLNRHPRFVYERVGRYLTAEEAGFFKFYGYESCSPGWEAFAGREFDIPMKDGSVEQAYGQWWDSTPPDYQGLVVTPGIGTVEGLRKCNVFCGGYVDPVLIEKWLGAFTPSNNYNKYCKGHKDEGKDIIVSCWKL